MLRQPQARQITEGVIWKQLLIFFFPILLGTFFQQMYNTVDTIIVGRFVSTHALAAVGATSALINLMNGFFIGLSSGATVILSQFFGAGDRQNIKSALQTGAALAILLGLIVTVLGLVAGPQILRLTKTPETSIADAVLYTRIYFTGAVASMIYNMGAGILNAMGDSRRPMIFLIITCFVNIIMDLICVVVLHMGIAGAAVATVISQITSAVLVISVLLKLPDDIRLHFSQIRLDPRLMKNILYIGIPAGLQFITFDLANLLIQSGVNSFGDTTIAAWTAYSKTDAITWMISSAFGVSVTTFVGQNFGAQKYDRIRHSVWVCMGMSVSLVASISALLLLLRTPILSIYTDDAEVIRLGAYVMLCIVPFNAIFMPVEVFAGAMRGTGYSIVPTVITCICTCVVRVLWVMVIVSKFHTIEMLAAAYPVSWILSASVFYITYLRGTWLHKRIAQCGMEPEQRQTRKLLS